MNNYPLNQHEHFTNLRQMIEHQCNQNPDYIAYGYLQEKQLRTVTYQQFYEDINNLGTFLYHEGMKHVKIAVVGENSYYWILSYFATVIGSNIIVPIDKELSDEEIVSLIQQTDVQAIIYSEDYKSTAELAMQKEIVDKIYSTANFEEYLQTGKALCNNGYIEYMQNEIDDNAVSTIIYTSGTTGIPKGVMLCQKGLALDTITACELLYLEGDSMLTLPLHHTFAFTAGVLALLTYGKTVYINSSIRTFMQDLRIFQPQNLFLVPLFVENIFKNISKNMVHANKSDILNTLGGNLNLIVSGGAPLDSEMIDILQEFDIQLINGYGITECSPVVSVNRNNYYKNGSIGLACPCNEVKVIDDEICVKGPNVMLGYYKDEQTTKDAFEGDYFKTGDLGYIDEDGFIFITGRKKNLIILANGKNVSPEELEGYISKIPNVIEVVVSGKEQVITAEIYAEDESGIKQQILELNKTLPKYKQIQKIIFRDDEFEKTSTKK